MKSVAYNEAMDYALEVVNAVKESGYEMGYAKAYTQFLATEKNR